MIEKTPEGEFCFTIDKYDPASRKALANHLRSSYNGRLSLWFYSGLADVMAFSQEGRMIGHFGGISWRREADNTDLRYHWE